MEQEGEMDVFVGMHIHVHMQGTHSFNYPLCGEQAGHCKGGFPHCTSITAVRVCALCPKPPSVLLPLLLLSVGGREVCKGDDSLEDERSGRPSEADSDQMLSEHH